MSEKGKKNKKKTGLGLAIWILTFLIILIVFLVKQEEIKSNFEKSGASALIEKKLGKENAGSEKSDDSNEIVIDLTKNLKKNQPSEKSEPKKAENTKIETADLNSKKENSDSITKKTSSDEKKTEVTLKETEKPSATEQNRAQSEVNSQTQSQQLASQYKNERTEAQSPVPNVQKQEAKTTTETKSVVQATSEQSPSLATNMTKAKICFVAIDSDGPVVRKEVTRSVHKDSPLGDALNMLLAGPSSTEAKTGCRSLIPDGTRLLSATVKNGVATLSFSEEFQFNQFGAEGSLAQLMQVVYTATNFSTVKSVQILIEGQKRDYLTEGVWIGSPLSKNSF